ncbi:hypothetical protein Tco_0086095 [Tanacetum coccineum]
MLRCRWMVLQLSSWSQMPWYMIGYEKGVVSCLNGELYFVKFIINQEEDDVEPGVVFGRSFLRLTKGIVDFGNGIITIYPDLVSFNDDSDDDWEAIIDGVDFSDLPQHDEIDVPTARSSVMQWMRSIISTVSISPEGFLPSILLLVVIIVTVVIVVVTVILVVVVVAIIGVVIVVTIIGVVVVVMIIGVVVVVMIIGVVVVVVSSIIKLSFVIIGSLPRSVLVYLYPLTYGLW